MVFGIPNRWTTQGRAWSWPVWKGIENRETNTPEAWFGQWPELGYPQN
jgi:hypothetical protein